MLTVIHFILSLLSGYLKVLRPGGVRALVTENIVLKQQLILIHRNSKRAPKLTTIERTLFGFATGFITRERLSKIAVILSPATLLKYHRALIKCKYRRLFSNKTTSIPGQKGPSQELITLILEMKQRNPRYGNGSIYSSNCWICSTCW